MKINIHLKRFKDTNTTGKAFGQNGKRPFEDGQNYVTEGPRQS